MSSVPSPAPAAVTTEQTQLSTAQLLLEIVANDALPLLAGLLGGSFAASEPAIAALVPVVGGVITQGIALVQAPTVSGIEAFAAALLNIVGQRSTGSVASDVKVAAALLAMAQKATAALGAVTGQPEVPASIQPITPIA